MFVRHVYIWLEHLELFASRTTVAGACTVSLVSRVPTFCCGGRTVKLNTALDSSWAQNSKGSQTFEIA